ncbi:MAG TPA: flavin reductase [Bryobacteraceae bacterium]|nr:flavin reductase [Bryobacteraceae bacterium]
MSLPVFQAVKRLAMGDSVFPQQVTVGMRDPQCEITVWLHGLGKSGSDARDVTNRHVMACVDPLTLGVVFDRSWPVPPESAKLCLRFVERRGRKRLLGEIRLAGAGEPFGEDGLRLFRVRGSSNYCLPKPRLWAHFAYLWYRRWRFNNNPEIKITPREAHTMVAFFICPRPVVLVSVRDGDEGNVFPMNLMGPISGEKFAFALNSTRHAAPIVVKARRAAISNVPLTEADLAKALGRNHLKTSIDLSDLPFNSRPSHTFGFPVPDFAVRVRELEIEASRRLGSHTFFVARLVHDEKLTVAQEFFYVHGIYQSWRVRNLAALAAR